MSGPLSDFNPCLLYKLSEIVDHKPVLNTCYWSVCPAHRYHQAKASGQGQGGQSGAASAHASRSTSPGPHWRNDGIAPYKPPDRRSMDAPSAPCAASSSSSSASTRPGRSRNPSGSTEPDCGAARTLLPRPPRDRSEPRHFNPLRWVCCLRMSADKCSDKCVALIRN